MRQALRAVRIRLKPVSVTESAAGFGSAIEVARRVPDQTCLGICPIVAGGREAVQHDLMAGRIQLEGDPVARVSKARTRHTDGNASVGKSAAVLGGAVEAARRVHDQLR